MLAVIDTSTDKQFNGSQHDPTIEDASEEIVYSMENDAANDEDDRSGSGAQTRSTLPAGIDELLAQLTSRQVTPFEPSFPNVVLSDSDDDDNEDGVRVDEQSERRLEKHGSRTASEELEKRNDGRQIRTTRISTSNSQRTSKSVSRDNNEENNN